MCINFGARNLCIMLSNTAIYRVFFGASPLPPTVQDYHQHKEKPIIRAPLFNSFLNLYKKNLQFNEIVPHNLFKINFTKLLIRIKIHDIIRISIKTTFLLNGEGLNAVLVYQNPQTVDNILPGKLRDSDDLN